MKRLGIYGGTFSPVHLGHVRAAQAFLADMRLDELLIMPTAKPPHKAAVEGASDAERFEMLQLAFAGCDARLSVCDFEIKRAETSYTVLTLEHFAAADTRLFLLVGTDMFLTLANWKRAEDIFRLAEIVLMRREADAENVVRIADKCKEYAERFGAKIHQIDEPPTVLSSTELRARVQSGRSTEGLIPSAVAAYIAERGLYRL